MISFFKTLVYIDVSTCAHVCVHVDLGSCICMWVITFTRNKY